MREEPTRFFTESTAGYWQELTSDVPARFSTEPPYRYGYPVRLPDGRYLVLPLRELPDGQHAVASLIVNQASFQVVDTLIEVMTGLARPIEHELIVGLPTLGLTLAPRIAFGLGGSRYVPLGYSRKFWYDDALSEPVASITSPEAGKHLRLDPNLVEMVAGRRVILVDDSISTGATAVAAIRLLRRLDARIAAVVVAMKQTNRWRGQLRDRAGGPSVYGVFGCPLFQRSPDGWSPLPETQPEVP